MVHTELKQTLLTMDVAANPSIRRELCYLERFDMLSPREPTQLMGEQVFRWPTIAATSVLLEMCLTLLLASSLWSVQTHWKQKLVSLSRVL